MTNETMTIKVINLEPTLEFLNEELEEAIADNLPTWQCTLKKQIARLEEIKDGVFRISSLSDFAEVIDELCELNCSDFNLYYNEGRFTIAIE
jgi:hypothetical protein